MKIGFYDSGLGGLSVLRSFLEKYKTNYSYYYFGDSANAPYGDKSTDEILGYMRDIFELMKEKEVDLVVSACNSSSALMHMIDRDDYLFEIISLADVLKDYFENNLDATIIKDFNLPVGFLATQASINAATYKRWANNIHPVACRSLVPFVEAGHIEEAKKAWQGYLDQLHEQIEFVIVGCTHYSFLITDEQRQKYKFIDPSDLVVDYFANSLFADSLAAYRSSKDKLKLDIEFQFSAGDENYHNLANQLLM